MTDAPPPSLQDFAAPTEVRLSLENPRVSDGARMGMAGLSYLRTVGEQGLLGIAVYGATSGDRGGFFGWGVHGAWRWRAGPWQAETGLFVGGGGGSPVWVGDGLMLRPYLELSREIASGLRLGAGVAQLRFPGALVNSTQPFVSLNWSDRVFFGPPGGVGAPAPGDGLRAQALPAQVTPFVARYSLRVPSIRRDGAGPGEDLRFGGLILRRALPGSGGAALQPYWLLSAGGSLTSAYAGFAELLAGVGAAWTLPFAPSLSTRAEAAIGSGGGGTRADTAGGLLGKASVGLAWQPVAGVVLAAQAGRIKSRGRLDANELRLEFGLSGWDVLPDAPRGQGNGGGPAALDWQGWTFAAGAHHFARAPRNAGGDLGLGSVALKAEREFGPHWRLTGLTSIATSGDAGGYATGQMGLGWLTAAQPGSPWRFGAELNFGAAGGGEVDVGNGFFSQAQLQLRYALSREWALQAEAGWLRSAKGAFSTPLVGVMAVYSFSRLQGR